MNTNDQWFSPGDKVMRVAYSTLNGLLVPASDDPKYGKIYSVVELITDGVGGRNYILLTGMRRAYLACNFRRVDEIKLCTVAAKHIRQREEEMV